MLHLYLYAGAQQRHFSLSFDASDFIYQESSGGMYISSAKYPIVFQEDTLSPALPFLCTYILVGPNDSLSNINLSKVESLLLNDVSLASNPEPVCNSTVNSVHVPYSPPKFTNAEYPETQINDKGTHDMNGYRVLSLLVCPFRYDAVNRQLFFCSHIDLTVDLVSSSVPKQTPGYSELTREDVEQLVINPRDIDALYGEKLFPLRQGTSVSDAPIQYVIVTCDSLKSEFQRLADWKTSKGCRTSVMSVENIYQNYNQRNNPLKIKYALKDIYDTSSHALRYVLLAGTASIVPVQICRDSIIMNNEVKAVTNNAADIFYGCFSDMDWDKNGNGYYGEMQDSISLYPTVIVSRLPARNNSDAHSMVDKILSYEMYPDTVGWKDEILLCGADTFRVYYEGALVSGSHNTSEKMYSQHIANAPRWHGSRFRLYDTGTDHPDGAAYDVTGSHLQAELQKGYPFINEDSHGSYLTWVLEDDSVYSFLHAVGLQAPRYNIISTDACYSSAFNYSSQCLGACFMQNPNSGTLAFYGCSDYNWGHPVLPIYGVEYAGRFYSNLFSGNCNSDNSYYHIGEAINQSKISFQADWYSFSVNRWLHLYLNPFCEPEMSVYASRPEPLEGLMSLTFQTNSIRLLSYDLHYRGCIMSRFDGGNNVYSTFNLQRPGDVFLDYNSSEEYLLTVLADDHWPYRAILGNTVKLQNESLSHGLNVFSKNTVAVGSNVDSSRDQGSVDITDGFSKIKGPQGTTIYDSFTVNSGASLLITPN